MQDELKPSSSSDKKKLRPKDFMSLKRAIQHEKIGRIYQSSVEDEEKVVEKIAKLTVRYDRQKLKQSNNKPPLSDFCSVCNEKFDNKNLLAKHRKEIHNDRSFIKKKKGTIFSMRRKKKITKKIFTSISSIPTVGLFVERIDLSENKNIAKGGKREKKIVVTIAGFSTLETNKQESNQENFKQFDHISQIKNMIEVEQPKVLESNLENQKCEESFSTQMVPSHEEIDCFVIKNLLEEGKISDHFNIFTKENGPQTQVSGGFFGQLLSNEENLMINLCDESKNGFKMLKKKILFIAAISPPLYFSAEWFNESKKSMKEKWTTKEKLAMPFSIVIVWLYNQINKNIFYKMLFLISFTLGYINKEARAKNMTEESYFIYFLLEGESSTQQMLSRLLELGMLVKRNIVIEINNSNLFLVLIKLLKDFLIAHNILSVCEKYQNYTCINYLSVFSIHFDTPSVSIFTLYYFPQK